jgi:hypothetical protein
VALNMTDTRLAIELPSASGVVGIGTDRSRDGTSLDGTVELGPWEGVVVALS